MSTDCLYLPGVQESLPWILNLNDMRFPHVEDLVYVCWANTLEELQAFVNREQVETYKDDKWGKTFRKFGPLEWYNKPWNEADHYLQVPPTIVFHGILEYRAPTIVNLPSIKDLESKAKYEHPESPTRFERITFDLVK